MQASSKETTGKTVKVKVKVKVKLKRSSVKPITKADKKLSIQHLQESVNFHKKHVTDHSKLLSKGGSKKYNKDHIKHHKKQMKDDKKLIKDRQKIKASEGKGTKERKAKRLDPGAYGTKTMSQPDVQHKAMTSAYKNTQVFGAAVPIPKGLKAPTPSWTQAKTKLKRAMKKL